MRLFIEKDMRTSCMIKTIDLLFISEEYLKRNVR